MQSYNPFGKGGAGAPYRDENGYIVSRRPYSVLRDQANPGPGPGRNAYLNQSVSNNNLPSIKQQPNGLRGLSSNPPQNHQSFVSSTLEPQNRFAPVNDVRVND